MAKRKIKLVTEERGTFKFTCPHPTGCGEAGTPWSSDNWPSRELAAARGKQHLREHETGADPDVETEVTPPLHEFYAEHGLVDANAVVAPNPDDWEI
jgi:hypothetical protein